MVLQWCYKSVFGPGPRHWEPLKRCTHTHTHMTMLTLKAMY
jgi:hypothetical protein